MGRQFALHGFDNALSAVFAGDNISHQTIFFQLSRRSRTDSGNFGIAQSTGIFACLQQPCKEMFYTIGAGEHQPMVILYMVNSLIKRCI